MTPMWKEELRPILNARHPDVTPFRDMMCRARCFDMRGAAPLVNATAAELKQAAFYADHDGEKFSFLVDIGERTVMPCLIAWLEFSGVSVMIEQSEESLAAGQDSFMWAWQKVPGVRQARMFFLGRIKLVDGEAWIGLEQHPSVNRIIDARGHENSDIAFMALAALAVISSPGVKRATVETHVGMARQMRAAGLPANRAIVHTRVNLLSATSEGGTSSGRAEHPKALHFCRAHTRTMQDGSIRKVRAHWRGDAAFGIRLPTYEFRANTTVH